jgi:hypothetical protein
VRRADVIFLAAPNCPLADEYEGARLFRYRSHPWILGATIFLSQCKAGRWWPAWRRKARDKGSEVERTSRSSTTAWLVGIARPSNAKLKFWVAGASDRRTIQCLQVRAIKCWDILGKNQ